MKLIADSGSTKTEWCIIDNDGQYKSFFTKGINPFYQSTQEIFQYLIKDFPDTQRDFQEIFFYGAGCASAEKNKIVEDALTTFFKAKCVSIESDLLGAARSLCQQKEGIVSILGTGSNSCHYNGKFIDENVSPLGYKLGDEGSGAVIGKKLIADILKKQLSKSTIELFFDTYHVKPEKILDNVYKETFPNRYLAQFTEFIADHIDIVELEQIVLFCFDEFVQRNLLQYNNIYSSSTYFTGSIAYHFSKQLKKVMKEKKIIIGNITQTPMEGLIKFHNKPE